MKKLSFRIRKRYFDAIVRGEKTVEYRRYIPFWITRVANILTDPKTIFPTFPALGIISFPVAVTGVFICGKRIHRREITNIAIMKTPDDFSDQGKKDVDTKFCFAFHLGEEISK